MVGNLDLLYRYTGKDSRAEPALPTKSDGGRMGDPLLIHTTARKMARDRDGDGCGTLGITRDILCGGC